VTAFAVFVNAL